MRMAYMCQCLVERFWFMDEWILLDNHEEIFISGTLSIVVTEHSVTPTKFYPLHSGSCVYMRVFLHVYCVCGQLTSEQGKYENSNLTKANHILYI